MNDSNCDKVCFVIAWCLVYFSNQNTNLSTREKIGIGRWSAVKAFTSMMTPSCSCFDSWAVTFESRHTVRSTYFNTCFKSKQGKVIPHAVCFKPGFHSAKHLEYIYTEPPGWGNSPLQVPTFPTMLVLIYSWVDQDQLRWMKLHKLQNQTMPSVGTKLTTQLQFWV